MASNDTPDSVKQKLERALKSKAVLAERSKQLLQQVDDFRNREESMSHIASELLERQRELNFMLHRASSVLHQLQDTNLALSAEFTHIVKELPAPEDKNWDDTVTRVNDLFKKTHELAGELQEDIFRTTQTPEIPKLNTEKPPAPPPADHLSGVQAEPPVVEPLHHEQYAPDLETIHEAEISEVIEHADEVRSEAADTPEDVTPEPEAEKPEVAIEQLFARVDTMQFDERDDDSGGRAAKPGFFAKLFSKLNEEV